MFAWVCDGRTGVLICILYLSLSLFCHLPKFEANEDSIMRKSIIDHKQHPLLARREPQHLATNQSPPTMRLERLVPHRYTFFNVLQCKVLTSTKILEYEYEDNPYIIFFSGGMGVREDLYLNRVKSISFTSSK